MESLNRVNLKNKVKSGGGLARDISVIEITENNLVVIACDSAGGIGSKDNDLVKVPGQLVGSLTTRVALIEILSIGAEPISIVNTLSVEYEPTGKAILEGIKQEVARIDLDQEIIINGSTEENIETSQTGIGITVVGRVDKDNIRMANAQVNDLVVAIGLPMVGNEVVINQEVIADLHDVEQLLQFEEVHEIIPVGSKGVVYEANLLARLSGLELDIIETELDLYKSAGPATTLIAAIPPGSLEKVKTVIDKPINIIGKLKEV